MKNPAVTSALVLIGLALAVGGFAWMSTDASGSGEPVAVLTRPEGEAKVSFTALTPREQRKKNNLEHAQRELHRIREAGEEVAPGVFKIKDETGDPTYYLGDLLPGKGRDGEPMYLAVQFKRTPAPPLKELDKKQSKKAKLNPKSKVATGVLQGGKSEGKGLGGNPGGESGSGGGSGPAGGGQDAGGGPK